MNLLEALEIDDLSPAEARAEINRHAPSGPAGALEREELWASFLAEVGELQNYSGEQVLGFLGY